MRECPEFIYVSSHQPCVQRSKSSPVSVMSELRSKSCFSRHAKAFLRKFLLPQKKILDSDSQRVYAIDCLGRRIQSPETLETIVEDLRPPDMRVSGCGDNDPIVEMVGRPTYAYETKTQISVWVIVCEPYTDPSSILRATHTQLVCFCLRRVVCGLFDGLLRSITRLSQ